MDTLPKPVAKSKSTRRFLIETLIMAFSAILIVAVINLWLLGSFFIPSGSMENTLKINDRVLVWKAYNLTGGIKRGDIVVFKNPGGWLPNDSNDSQFLIKRVIGLPGDKVACCDAAGNLTINDKSVVETFLNKNMLPSEIPFTVKVPAGDLWVMGDNRSNSDDSRYQTTKFVPIKDVVGTAFVRFYPNITFLSRHADIYDQ